MIIRAPAGHASPTLRHDHHYRAHGVVLQTDFAFTELEPVEPEAPTVTAYRFDGDYPDLGPAAREVREPDGTLLLGQHIGPYGLQIEIPGVGRFWVDPSGTRVRYRLYPGAVDGDVEAYLIGPVLTLAAEWRGELVFHAGAIAFDGGALAFTAPSGYGKSTLTAMFAREGYPVLSDDVLPVRDDQDTPIAIPYLPRLKLWGDSIAALGERVEDYEPLFEGYEKRRVRVEEHGIGRLAGDPLPLRAFYQLAPHLDESRRDEVVIDALDPAAGCLLLHASVYTPELMRGDRAARTLARVARIARGLPVRTISYYRGYEQLAAVRRALVDDARAVIAERPA